VQVEVELRSRGNVPEETIKTKKARQRGLYMLAVNIQTMVDKGKVQVDLKKGSRKE